MYDKVVKDKNVNSKCTHRQITRLWLTNDRPGLSSERTPHRDRTTISDPNTWKRSNIWSNVHKVGSTPRHTDSLSAVKWLWLWQMTDPASRQRGRSAETGHQIPDPNSWEGSNIWSNVHKVSSTPRHTDWLSAMKWPWFSEITQNVCNVFLFSRVLPYNSSTIYINVWIYLDVSLLLWTSCFFLVNPSNNSNCTCIVLYDFWLIPHPVVIWLTYGSMECNLYVCIQKWCLRGP
jgi:hypothetical protein